MQVLYIGDARNVRKRILNNHIQGNIESSVLRKHIAVELGFKLKTELRAKGSYRIRIDAEDRNTGENRISEFIKFGMWRVLLVDSYEEAHELQWFVISRLSPPLNRRTKEAEEDEGVRYEGFVRKLTNSALLGQNDIAKLEEGPGIYAFYSIWRPGLYAKDNKEGAKKNKGEDY